MDYMHLGSKSRKTGFELNKKVDKDEHSMENMDAYFDEEESKNSLIRDSNNNKFDRQSQKIRYIREFDPNRSGLSIKSPSQMNIIPPSRGSICNFVLKTPSLTGKYTSSPPHNETSSHRPISLSAGNVSLPQDTYKSDLSNFQTNYGIPETILEEEEEKEKEEDELPSSINERVFRQSLPDLVDEFEVEYSTEEESSLLNTSQDALLESEIDSKYLQPSDDDNTPNSNYNVLRDGYSKGSPGTSSKAPLRRSSRIKIPTLDYWRNEKVVYKRRSEQGGLDIAKVITYDEDKDVQTNIKGGKKRKYTINDKNKRKNVRFDDSDAPKGTQPDDINSEILQNISRGNLKGTKWIDNGILEGTILGRTPLTKRSKTKKEILAVAPNYINNEREYHSNNDNYRLSILFNSQKEHFANGYLTLPVNGQKSKSSVDDLYLTFHVLKGIIEVTISENNKFICIEGSTFQVPSHNSYSLINKGNDEVKLYFVQIIINI